MSRTKKDAPWWYRAEWWVPWHLNCPHDERSWHRNTRACDLPDAPLWEDAPRGVSRARGCVWGPPREPFRCRCEYCRRPYRRRVFRASDRDYGRIAVTEYRATGAVSTEPPLRRPVGPAWCDF